MKKFIQTTIEGLHYFFSGDPDEENQVPYKQKVRGVVLYSIVIGTALFLYWLLQQR